MTPKSQVEKKKEFYFIRVYNSRLQSSPTSEKKYKWEKIFANNIYKKLVSSIYEDLQLNNKMIITQIKMGKKYG